jgi:hypothetical protein
LSSRGFETVLAPVARLRKLLLAFSAGALLAGTALVLRLPLRMELKLVVVCLWLVCCLLEMRSQLRGMSRIDRIRMYATGSLEGLSRNGRVEPLKLLSGSVVLSRVAWLRLELDDGLRYGELLAGNPRRDEQWRRLQLIWRQQAGVFGGPKGS